MIGSPHPPTPSAWLAQVLRLTCFFAESVKPSGQNWWAATVGEEPENRTTQQKGTLQQDDGPFALGTLTLQIQPNRADWVYGARVGPELADEIPSLGELRLALEEFERMGARWLEQAPQSHRLAFGAIFVQPTTNHVTGYELIDRYLSCVQLKPDARDFLFRINRPRDSLILPGVLVNRLSTWSVVQVVSFHTQFSTDGFSTAESGPSRFAGRLELDINTDKDRKERLPHEQLPRVFRELTGIGAEIAERGDIG